MVLAPSAILIPGTGTRTLSHPDCGCHPTLSLNHRCSSPAPGLAECPLSPHGHSAMDMPAHPNAKPFPGPLPGLGKCHQPLS